MKKAHRTITLSFMDKQQLYDYFDNRRRNSNNKKPLRFYVGSRTPFGVLRFWR